MTPDPISIPSDMTVANAYTLMLSRGVRRLPVVERDNELIGIVTRSDIEQVLPRSLDERDEVEAALLLAGMPVREVMTWDPVTVSPDDTIQDAAESMIEFQVSGLPVVEGGELVGIITESDIFRIIARSWIKSQ
jgi:acetoin utilization protein AcuB